MSLPPKPYPNVPQNRQDPDEETRIASNLIPIGAVALSGVGLTAIGIMQGGLTWAAGTALLLWAYLWQRRVLKALQVHRVRQRLRPHAGPQLYRTHVQLHSTGARVELLSEEPLTIGTVVAVASDGLINSQARARGAVVGIVTAQEMVPSAWRPQP